MKNYLLFFFFCVNTMFAQIGLTNITNYCAANPNVTGSSFNYTYFEQIGNLLVFRTPGECMVNTPEGPPFKVWVYDGVNSPYSLKFPDGSDFLGLNTLDYNDILKVGGKIYLNCDASDNSKDGLYFFDPNISMTHVTKVVSDSFPDDCKGFEALAKYNNGIIYEGYVNRNCFYNPNTNSSTYLFDDFRKSNGYGGKYFSNAELNGNFYFTTNDAEFTGHLIKKYNSAANTSEVIASTATSIEPYPNGKTVFLNKLYYINKKAETGVELFQYDGTSETAIDINPGPGSSSPNLLTVVNNKMYFTCYYNNKYYLYKYDGISPPEMIHQEDFNLLDFYSGMCELNNELYLIKSYSTSVGGNTALYKYSESSNTLVLLNTFNSFYTAYTSSYIDSIFYGNLPQFYENKRGYLLNFKNELYILGRKFNGNTITGASNDIWKIDNGVLKTIEMNSEQNLIKYYPNPTKNDLNVSLDKTYKSIDVNIIASDGKIVKKQNFVNSNTVKIQIPQTSGIYYITLMYDNKITTHKIIKE